MTRTDRIEDAPLLDTPPPPKARVGGVHAKPQGVRPEPPPAPPPPLAAGARRVPRVKEKVDAITTTVYFYDREKIERLDAICKGVPRCSMAKVLNQLVDAFLNAHAVSPEGSREIVMGNAKVYL